MNEPRKVGRPRKHLEEDHHFKTAGDVSVVDNGDEYISEPQVQPLNNNVEKNIEVPAEGHNFITAQSSGARVYEHINTNTEGGAHDKDEEINEESIDVSNDDKTLGVSSLESDTLEVNNAALHGWNSIDTEIILKQPPRNGMPVRLSETPNGEGILAFWKRTRAFNGKRYAETGKWTCFQTGMNLSFEPKYWKERFGV